MTTYSAAPYKPHWIRADFIDFVLEKINPLLSYDKVKAKLVKQEKLSPDMFQVYLEPNNKFNKIWQAGQSVLVTVQIAGVFHQRSYSIVDVTSQGQVVLGIKAQGLVSNYLTQTNHAIVEISQAQGDFVLNNADTAPLLLIASGSGITAIYSLLKQAINQKVEKIDVLYFNRYPVFHREILALAEKYPQLNYRFINTTEEKQHFEEVLVSKFCPEWLQTKTYVCGASPLMQAVHALYAAQNKLDLLHSEYFQTVIDENATEQPVTFRRSQRDFMAAQSLLVSAEQAGLKPSHGCRMGVCNTCTCTKVSGVTKNIVTGEIETEDNRPIKLCISQALSPIVIDL